MSTAADKVTTCLIHGSCRKLNPLKVALEVPLMPKKLLMA